MELERIFTLSKGQWVGVIAGCIVGVGAIVFALQARPKPVSYIKAEEAFARWEGKPVEEALYRDMERALHEVPALESKYEAAIAQGLLNGEKVEQALEVAQRPLQRLKEEAPFHALFGETSLLVEQGAFQEALERSVHLKEEMGKDPQKWEKSALYAHNLLRIAFLQKALENGPGEKSAWEELEAFLERSSVAPMIYGNFKEKGVGLNSYISERKRLLAEQS